MASGFKNLCTLSGGPVLHGAPCISHRMSVGTRFQPSVEISIFG